MQKVVPIIPIRDGIIFPNTDSVLTFGRPKSLAALELSFSQERIVCFALQKSARVNDPSPSDIYTTGTLCRIERMIKTEGEINAKVRGLSRVKINSFHENENFLIGHVEELLEDGADTPEIKALCNHLTNEFRRAMNLGKTADFLVFMNIMSPDNPPTQLADLIASVLDLKPTQKQELLETIDIKARLERVTEFLSKEIKVLELERKIASKTAERFEKGAREVMLRERLKTIEKELGESDEDNEIKEILTKIKEAGMPEEIEEKARKEAKKLAQMAQFNPEAGYIRNYLDWLLSVPWSAVSKSTINIKTAEYPGVPTDLQSPLSVLLTQANGKSLIFETIFEGRLDYLNELSRMGADVTVCDPHRAIISGPSGLRGREMESPDLRAGLAFIIAALVAKGKSIIHNVYNIDRGYERIEERLRQLGADIKRI